MLAPLEAGVVIDPILSTGDIVGGYQMSGIPDGLGAYKTGRSKLNLMMNHELDQTLPDSPAGVGSRISKLTLDRASRTVLSGSYPLTGLEGFVRFCSATLEVIKGTPCFFAGEEDVPTAGRGGSSIAMNADTGEWVETRHFGLILHENNVPVERLSKAMIVTTDDDFRAPTEQEPHIAAYLYAWIGDTWEGSIAGTDGSLYVWKADEGNSPDDIEKGETIPGRFVPISQAENANGETLELASHAKGGFKFVRLEDAATAQQHPGRLYFADTGRLPSEDVRGSLYRLDIDPTDPTRASLTLLLSGDAGDDIVNPDNLDTSPHSVVIQEDRNSEHRGPEVRTGYGRILVYDIKSGTVRVVARPTTPPAFRPGEWESSGVINAQSLLGEDWWLVDVQAHSTFMSQPGASLTPNSGSGEDGQLLAIKIPNS
jgi:hypothetical protein